MSVHIKEENLISHFQSHENIEATISQISKRIKSDGDKLHVSVNDQLELLIQMSQFALGRFLLQNQGLNGYWTHYILTYPWTLNKFDTNESLTKLEQFLLERAPTLLATQQRFKIFLEENQKSVEDNAKLACIPSGSMGELLYLNLSGKDNLHLIGIDYDVHALEEAKSLAEKQNLSKITSVLHADAWNLTIENEYDLISSNGLNIYEPNSEKVKDLYRQFHKALKPRGKLVTSFLTYPPTLTKDCEWNLNEINKNDLLLQRIIFMDILNAKWQSFRSTKETREQLESVGFKTISFLYDEARLFSTVVAEK